MVTWRRSKRRRGGEKEKEKKRRRTSGLAYLLDDRGDQHVGFERERLPRLVGEDDRK